MRLKGELFRDNPKSQSGAIMTKKSLPEDIYPVALRKIFNDSEIAGPLELSVEEIKEAREWKRQLDLDIAEIDKQLNNSL